MNEEEAFFRRQLRRVRYLATSIGYSCQEHEIMFSRWPQTQAWEILDEKSCYGLAARMLVTDWLTPEKLEGYKYSPSTGLPATKEEIFKEICQQQERRLKEKLDPSEVYPQVVMPWVKSDLESIESYMVEQGYRLPKWERPKWLKQLEGKG